MPLDFGPKFEAEAQESFDYWKVLQNKVVTDPILLAKINSMTLIEWLTRILRAPVYENLGKKRANIDEAGSFFQPIVGSIDSK